MGNKFGWKSLDDDDDDRLLLLVYILYIRILYVFGLEPTTLWRPMALVKVLSFFPAKTIKRETPPPECQRVSYFIGFRLTNMFRPPFIRVVGTNGADSIASSLFLNRPLRALGSVLYWRWLRIIAVQRLFVGCVRRKSHLNGSNC